MGIRVKAEDARVAAVTGVFALRGGNRHALVATLERIAAIAPHLSGAELRNLACQLSRDLGARPPGRGDGEIRVGVAAQTQIQLAERARLAADLVSRVQNGSTLAKPGVRVSCGAGGRLVLVFPGLAPVPVTAAATLAGSLGALRWLDRLGVTASAAVGHGLGELAGLVWAGSLSAPEAARLAAQYGQALSGMSVSRTAMVRIAADQAAARVLSGGRLVIAAYEGPRSHVLAGPVPAVREAARQAARLGIAADVLDVGHALHSPAMAGCAAPLRSVLAQIHLGPPSRRLVSTVTARELTARDDIVALLWAQLTSPVRFAEALHVAAADADLLLVAGAGTSPDPSALSWCGLPITGLPARGGPAAGRPGVSWDGPGIGDGPLGGEAAADRAVALFAAGVMPRAALLTTGQPVQPIDIWHDRYLGLGTAAPPGHGRFMETVTTLRPGAELVAEARVSARTDPYLADYLIDGRAVLPAAIGLEAMAQAASALARQPMRSARGVTLGAPVVIAEGGQVVLRVQARVSGDGVETVLQAGSGGRLGEHARAVFVGSGVSSPAAGYLGAPVAGDTSGTGGNGADSSAGILMGIADDAGIVDGADLYGSVCFQTGRFRRVALVSGTPPASCRAIVRGRDDLPWFGCVPALTDLLVLGSPGVNDAVLQVVQACVPHRRLLPGGCDSLTVSGTEVPGAVELRVFLVSAPPGTAACRQPIEAGAGPGEAGAAEYVWDVHGYDGSGHPVAAWIGLRMRDAGPLHPGRMTIPDATSMWWGTPREPALSRAAGNGGTISAAYVAREPVP